MKRIFIAILAVPLFLILQSCKKEKTPWEKTQESNSGVITAKLNGKDWTGQIARAYINSSERFGIGITQFSNEVATEQLYIDDIYLTKTVNHIHNIVALAGKKDSTRAAFSLVDDDVIYTSYFAADDSSVSNFVYVDKYDAASGVVTGRFDLTLYLAHGNVAIRNWPDTLRFTDGKFHLTIKK